MSAMPVRLGTDSEGRVMLGVPYDEKLAEKSLRGRLKQKAGIGVETEANGSADAETPQPDSMEDQRTERQGGPIRRFNEVFTDLGSVRLEALGMDGYEIARATGALRDEMYRSEFPIIQSRFEYKCLDDDCGSEYDSDVGFCISCARSEMRADGVDTPPTDPEEVPEEYRDHPVRPPDESQKREAQRLAESVNKEGQTLRELMKVCEDDQSRIGVSVVVARKNYYIASGEGPSVFAPGEVIYERVDELVRGDPKRIVPVVDENGRVGNHWWACPAHREDPVKKDDYEEGHTHCEECNAALREVYFVETERAYANTRRGPVKYYFEDEVVTWARHFPRLNGLDGLSPVHHIWLKQAILHWMDIYGSAFYDPESDRYPNKFMVVHTTNPDLWEKQFEKAEEDAKENPYSQQIMMNQYSSESRSTPEVQVIDLMNDTLLGQDEQMKKQYKSDIRQHFGVTDVFDSELSDAGGLNNEGLQMEVTDRAIATAMHDTRAGPLDELSKVLGISDYIYGFVPEQETDLDELQQAVTIGDKAAKAGLDPSIEDGRLNVPDGEFEAAEEGGGGGLGGLFGAAEFGEEDGVAEKFDPMAGPHQFDPGEGVAYCEEAGESWAAETWDDLGGECPHCGGTLLAVAPDEWGEETAAVVETKAVGDDEWSDGIDVFRVLAAPDQEDDYDDRVLGVGVSFPEAGVYVDWHREAFPDELDEPHVSEYGSVDDLRKATGNLIEGHGHPPEEDEDPLGGRGGSP